MVTVSVENHQKKLRLNPPKIARIAKTILRLEKVKSATVTLCFVTAQKIRALNHKYLKRSYSTDVLAFNLSEEGKPLVGDVIISADAAIKNAKQYNEPLEKEVSLYIIHGLLHLLGYDDQRRADIQKMRSKEKALLTLLGSQIKSVLR